MKLIVFDTNAWLDLYMIHPLALKEIIMKFEKEKELFWIPEQVYWEFCNHSRQKRENALNVIKSVSSNAREKVSHTNDQIKKELAHLKNNVILSDDKIINDIETKFNEIRELIKRELEILNCEYQKRMGIITEEQDIIHKLVNAVYKTNPPYILTEVQRVKLYEEGELRIKYNIPPGLTDINKEDTNENVIYRRRYGDFLIWKDVLRKTEELVQTINADDILSIIFVENEKKGDWWIRKEKPIIAPILKEEFDFIAKGKAKIEMMDFSAFLAKYCNLFRIDNITVKSLIEKNKYKENVISEINNTSKEILERALVEYFTPVERCEKLFNTKSYLGGTFESVKDFSVAIKEITDVRLDEDDLGLRLGAKIEFEYSGKLSEYIDNTHNETGIVKDTYNIVLITELSIDYSQGYNSNHYDIGKIYAQGFQAVKRLRLNSLRNKVFERDEYTCQICGKTRAEGAILCIDYIVPRVLGGTSELTNLQTLCVECNTVKGTSIM